MTKIGIITYQDGYNRGACDFYPLIRWKKELKDKGIKVNFFRSHKHKGLFKQDFVGFDSRYYRRLIVNEGTYPDLQFVVDSINQLREKGIKIVIFDNDDSSGGRQWSLIQYVDLLVKKQVLKDRTYYASGHGQYNYKPFLREYDLPDTANRNVRNSDKYITCPPDHLDKIKLGWNIGMIDYRYFPLSDNYPIGTSRLLNRVYDLPSFEEPGFDRPFDSVFRGQLNKENVKYSYQRNKVIELFGSEKYPGMITGDIIHKRQYLEEMQKSKTCVSPFGWGEVCYRDFEAIINGALLIKPDMDHVETYPDIYKKNETYVSIQWNMEDLEKTLNEVLENYGDYISIACNAQEAYREALCSSDQFIQHVSDIFKLN